MASSLMRTCVSSTWYAASLRTSGLIRVEKSFVVSDFVLMIREIYKNHVRCTSGNYSKTSEAADLPPHWLVSLRNDLVQRILNDPRCAAALEPGDQVTCLLFVQDHFQAYPFGIGLMRDRRRVHGGQKAADLLQVRLWGVYFEPDLFPGGKRALEQHGHVLYFLPLPRVTPRLLVRDEPGCGLQHHFNDAKLVRLERAAGLGQLHDRIGKLRRLHFRGAPGELDVGGYSLGFKITFCISYKLGGDALSLQVLERFDLRILGH